MNQEQNNLNQNNFNITGNNENQNTQTFVNNQNFNNEFNQSGQYCTNNLQPLSDPQLSSTYNYQESLSQDNTIQAINNSLPTKYELETLNDKSSINSSLNNKSNQNKLKFIVPIIVIVLGVVIFFVIKFIIFNNVTGQNPKKHIENTPIIIKNGEELYALYNSSGEKITEFKYKSIDKFINNVSLVTQADSSYEILDNKGNIIVAFDKYKEIRKSGNYLFEAEDNNYDKYLINNKGEVIYDLSKIDADVDTFSSSGKVIAVETDKFYDIIGKSGNSILKLQKYNIEDEIELYFEDTDYLTVFYNNISYILNLEKEIIMSQFNSETLHYVSDYYDSNTNKYIIVKSNDEGMISFKDFSLMDKDKVIFTKNCSNMYLSDDNESVVCLKGYSSEDIYIDKNGKELGSNEKNIINYDTYIHYKEKNKATFYKSGKELTTIDCVAPLSQYEPIASKSKEIFSLKGVCEHNYGKYYYYYSNGQKFIDKDFLFISTFDNNNLAKVSEIKGKYYLININGEKITEEYDYISFKEFGSTFLDFDNSVYYGKLGNEYIVFNTNGKEVLKTKGEITIYFNYFTVEDNNELIYYTLNGKEFYRKNNI